jgi:MFS family permease
MFLPQVITAITASLLGSSLAHRISAKKVLLLGLACNITAMLILVVSTTVKTDTSVAYPLLLVATAFLGAGFGLTVPILNTFVSDFHPAGGIARSWFSTPCSDWAQHWPRCSWLSSSGSGSGGAYRCCPRYY